MLNPKFKSMADWCDCIHHTIVGKHALKSGRLRQTTTAKQNSWIISKLQSQQPSRYVVWLSAMNPQIFVGCWKFLAAKRQIKVRTLHLASTSYSLTFNFQLCVYELYNRNNSIPDQIARDIIEHSANIEIPIVIGADCNAHNTLWGSSNINERGMKLAEYLATTCLDICNVDVTPTFVSRARREVLKMHTCEGMNIKSHNCCSLH